MTWCHRLACSRYNQLLYYLKTRHLYILNFERSEVGDCSYQTLLFKLDVTDMGFPSKINSWSLEIIFWFIAHYCCDAHGFNSLNMLYAVSQSQKSLCNTALPNKVKSKSQGVCLCGGLGSVCSGIQRYGLPDS